MDDKQIKIMLMFGTDAAKANAELSKMSEKFQQAEKRANELKKTLEFLKSIGQDTKKVESDLQGVEKEMADISIAAKKVEASLEGMSKGSRDVRDNLYQLRDIGEKLNNIGMGMQNAGRTLLSPLQGAMSAFLQQQQMLKEAGGVMSVSAKKYLDAQKQMQEAYIRIGAIAVDKLLPTIEKAADLVNKFANFIEKNPTLVTAIAGLGVGLSVVGSVVSAIGQMYMIAGSLQALGIGGVAAGGGAAAGGAAAGGIAATAGSAALLIAAPIVGANLAKWVGNAFQKSIGVEESSWNDIKTTAQQLAIIASPMNLLAEGANHLGLMSDETRMKVFDFQKTLVGLGDAAEETGKKAETTEQQLAKLTANKQFTQAYTQYQAETKQAETDYYNQRAKIMTDAQSSELNAQRSYQASLASLNARYRAQTASTIANYNAAEKTAEQNYYLQRSQLVASANAEIQNIELQHQERLRSLREDHLGRVEDLTAARDALGLDKENESYARARQDENRNAKAEIAAKRQEVAMRLKEMAAQYAMEKQQRAEQLKLQLAEAAQQHALQVKEQAEQYKLEQARMREQKAAQLKELDAQHKAEQARRRNAFYVAIRDIDQTQLNERNRRIYWYTLALQDADNFGRNLRSKLSQNAQSRDSGGRGIAGSAYLIGVGAQPELFVPNSNGTFIPNADRMGRPGTQISLQQEITFNGDLSAGNKAQFRTFMRDVALEAFSEVIR